MLLKRSILLSMNTAKKAMAERKLRQQREFHSLNTSNMSMNGQSTREGGVKLPNFVTKWKSNHDKDPEGEWLIIGLEGIIEKCGRPF